MFGLVLSVALMGLASSCIAGLLNKHRWIAWVGLIVILYVALNMIYEGWHDISEKGLPLDGLTVVRCVATPAAGRRARGLASDGDLGPDRHVVGGLFATARLDLSMPQATRRSAACGRQQDVVDADAAVLRPGAGLVVPEGVDSGRGVDGRTASVRPRFTRRR